jgi:hypothetical protein
MFKDIINDNVSANEEERASKCWIMGGAFKHIMGLRHLSYQFELITG